MLEYGVTPTQLEDFEKRTHTKIKKARKEGRLQEFSGDTEALIEGQSH